LYDRLGTRLVLQHDRLTPAVGGASDRRGRAPQLLGLAFRVLVAGSDPHENAVVVALILGGLRLCGRGEFVLPLDYPESVHRTQRLTGATERDSSRGEAGPVELRDLVPRAVANEAESPAERRTLNQLRLESRLPRLALDRTGVLPLRGVSVHSRERNQDELVLDLRVRIRELQRIAVAEDHVHAEFRLRRQLRFQEAVAERLLYDSAA